MFEIPVSGTEAATLFVMCKIGSRNESAHLAGASHFIEHLMFKGTRRRPNTLKISQELDSVGAEYNAFTGKDLTGYYIKIEAEHMPMASDLLHDMLFSSRFDSKEMNREKKVILEEINMYHDNPMFYVEELMESALFGNHPLGREIAGSHESMLAMKREDVIKYRNSAYVPENMIVAIAGNVDPKSSALVKRMFGSVPKSKKETKIECESQSIVHALPSAKIQKKKSAQSQISIGFPTVGYMDKTEPAIKILSLILGGSMSSRLFVEVRERKGLAYSIGTSVNMYEGTGAFVVQAGLDRSRIELACKIIRAELEKVKKRGVSAKELRMAKDCIKGRMALQMEDSHAVAEFYLRQALFLPSIQTPRDRLHDFFAVTQKQIQKAANDIFDIRRIAVGAIGPFNSTDQVLKLFAK